MNKTVLPPSTRPRLSAPRGFPFLVLPLVVLLAAFPAKGSSIVSDGGFESPTATPVLGPPYTGALGDGWTVTSGSIAVFSNGTDIGSSHSGNQFAYLDWAFTANTLTQNLTTVPGQEYAISWWLADDFPNSVHVSFGGTSLFSGVSPTGGVTSPADYVQYTFNGMASSTSTAISFAGLYTKGNGTLLDDVSVTAVSSVPEPAGYILLGCGLLAIAILRRRQGLTAVGRSRIASDR